MKRFLLVFAVGLMALSAFAQNTAISTINNNILGQGSRGITADKMNTTLVGIVNWAGSPALKRFTIAQTRALATDWPNLIQITDGSTAGLFSLDATDSSTPDNGTTVIVSTNGGKRYKRISDAVANITGLQTALDTKAPIANARLTGTVGVNVPSPSYDVDVAGGIRAQTGGVMGSGTMNANAILDLQSTNKVFLPPRMTQAQRLAIASGAPTAGAIVYQTDGMPGLYYYVNGSWRKLFNSSGELLPANLVGGAGIVSNAEYESLYGLRTATSIQKQIDSRTHKDSLSFSWNSTNGTLGLSGISGGSVVNLNTWGNGRYIQQTGGNLTGVLGMTNASGLQVYNSSTITADYERGNIGWQNNVFTIDATRGGSGSLRPVGLKSISNTFNVNPGPSLTGRIFDFNAVSSVGAGQGVIASTGNISNSTGNTFNTGLFSTVNQSGSAGHSELYISPYFQAVGGSPRYLIRAGTNSAGGGSGTHTDAFTVDQNGGTVIGGSLSVLGAGPIYSDAGIRIRGLAGIFLAQSIPDVQSRYSAYQWKINGSADNDYNASFMLQHTHKYDMFASANTYTPLRIYQNKVNVGSNALPTEVLTVSGNTLVSGNVSNTGDIISTGNLNVGEGSDATAKVVTIGNGRTANGTVGINFIGDTGGNSGLSIQRQGSAGVNSRTDIVHRGTGDFNIHAYEAAKIDFATAGVSRLSISSTGNVSLRGAAANGELQFPQTTTNKKLVLFENVAGNDHEYYGFGINTSILRYQASNVNASHVFYAATSSTTSNELVRINNTGVTMKGVQTFVAGDGSMSNTIEGGYSLNGVARTLLLNNSSSNGTEGFFFRNSNLGTNIMSLLNRGNVGIGTTLPHISTILDLVSTTAGLGLPRMTTTQINAISSPQAGLTVYNSTLGKICYYNGTAWKQVTDSNM